ncbi:MAG: hypothetical protein HY284_05895 [Nitrospirae bacterium]|nr:hypothetical protein [Nitrospirota bacterium]
MDPVKKEILGLYLAAVFVAMMIVPCTGRSVFSVREYYFLFSREAKFCTIEYGTIFIELIAISCVAGILFLFPNLYQGLLDTIGRIIKALTEPRQAPKASSRIEHSSGEAWEKAGERLGALARRIFFYRKNVKSKN